ncbi:MAG: type VI secretion system tube protein TssD [bacterium]|nr:type VI secretion system tube protein TssD [bacterium]MDY3142990.1 type VI secretion system tube protein TssD [Parabacteroides sp.]
MAANVTPVQLAVQDFEPREVILVDYAFTQATDIEGQIAGIPRGGQITIRVKAMNDGNNQLLQWMLAPNDPRDLKVTFSNTIDGTTMKEIEGKGCYCIHYVEKWEDGEQHFEEMQIVCQELKNGPVSFENPWK